MDALIKELGQIGFSSLEASVYIAVLEAGELTGYQIAKRIGAAKSSVYNILESLRGQGILLLVQGNPSRFRAEAPSHVIGRIKQAFERAAAAAEADLSRLGPAVDGRDFVNIQGLESLLAHARDLIEAASAEVLLNMDFDIGPLAPALVAARDRGVRVVVFSWCANGADRFGLEYHTHNDRGGAKDRHRLMLVTDFARSLIGSNLSPGGYVPHRGGRFSDYSMKPDQEYTGVFSGNPLLAYITAEHIHLDIYQLKLQQKYGRPLVSDELRLNTLMEGPRGTSQEYGERSPEP